MKIKLLLLFLCSLISFSINAEAKFSGKIAGRVLDKSNNESLIGVPVLIEGTTIGTTTDIDGHFAIGNLEAGIYSVRINFIGYSPKTVTGILVKEAEVTTLTVALESGNLKLNEVTVSADLKRENTGAILLMQKRSATVQDGISSEAIKKTPDKNSGEVIRRISGASLQEGRFVVIRGLNERYNAAMLNGMPLASNEPDRKAFSFDLFPASLLDNLLIVKTAMPELPGDFSGGILQLNTKDIPDKTFLSFTAGTGFNSQSTFKSYRNYNGGKTDWQGRDDGTRALPSDFPTSDVLKKAKQQDKINYSKLLPNDWEIKSHPSSPLSQNYQTSFGTKKKFGKSEFGMTGAVSYSTSNKTTEVKRADYNFDGSPTYEYDDQQYRSNVLWGSLFNLSYKSGENTKLSFKNIYSINAEDITIIREGKDIENMQQISASALKYSSTKFSNSLLTGEHYLTINKSRIKWYGGITSSTQSVPNLRRMYYYKNIPADGEEDQPMSAYVPFGTASPNYAGKFFSDLDEKIYNGEVSYLLPLKFIGEKQTIKAGLFEQYKERSFDARVLGYVITNPSLFDYTLLNKPIESLFAEENMGVRGFRIDEITNPSDHYSAASNLHAGFVQFDNSIAKYRFVWGIRVENFIQKLNSLGYSNDTVTVKTNYTDILPSINVIYTLSEKTNLRLAGSKTIARPEFRELAPFGFYDFSTATSLVGNDSLKRTEIYNGDIRIEYYPSVGQILSFTSFYKHFVNPIEPVVESSGAGSRRISFQNAPSAFVFGVEMEWRKTLDFFNSFITWKYWENFSIYGNVALMKSRVDKSNDLRANEDRPLQGQSPYVINAGLAYYAAKNGLGFNLIFNRIGPRIYQVGNSSYLSIEEAPRNLLDIQLSKRFFEKAEVKITVSDILNEQSVFYQDQNHNGRYAPDVDSGISNYSYGLNTSVSLSWTF
jgi:hypothetical protein